MDRSAAGDTGQHQCGDLGGSEGTHRPRLSPGSEPAPCLSSPRVGCPPPRCLITRGGLRAGPPVSMAMGGCFPPRPLPFSAAAGEQPQPARRHRGGGTGAPDRAGGKKGGTGADCAPSPGSRSPPAVAPAWQRCSTRRRVRPAEVSVSLIYFIP